jgi:hypothetical protein
MHDERVLVKKKFSFTELDSIIRKPLALIPDFREDAGQLGWRLGMPDGSLRAAVRPHPANSLADVR